MTKEAISKFDDIIDSRDVIGRIEELESTRADLAQAVEDGEVSADAVETWDEDEEGEELKALKALVEEASGYSPDWQYGATLIRDSYFQTYAEELAEDCGMIPAGLAWPCTCIDWERAARELQMDYTSVEFDGVTYWVR